MLTDSSSTAAHAGQNLCRTAQPASALPNGKNSQAGVAPGSKGLFVDEATGEVRWRALACRAPNCPDRVASGEPYLFTENDLSYFAKPDKSVGFDPKRAKQQPKQVGLCPKCNEILDPATATPTQGVQHSQWVPAYVLPESLARSQSPDAELRRRVTFDRGSTRCKGLQSKARRSRAPRPFVRTPHPLPLWP